MQAEFAIRIRWSSISRQILKNRYLPQFTMASQSPLRVLVWDENPSHAPKDLYPTSLRGAVAEGLKQLDPDGDLVVETACLDDADQGVPKEKLDATDVLIWWGHARHGEVDDELAESIKKRCHEQGMGLIVLHSGHYSKIFTKTVGGPGHLKGGWREAEDSEEIVVAAPWHPIAQGVDDFTLPNEEMYGAPFDVPPFETLIFQSRFSVGNETFPSGIVWTVGEGIDPKFTSGPGNAVNQGEGKCRLFYFRPGHETYPTYFDPNVRKVIYNGVRWVGRRI
jgi:trehalose utilization protein